jgi:lysophospholipase L1-like esterase
MRRGIAIIAAFVLLLGSVGSAAASGGPKPDDARTYYVSVGDSLAAGVQPIGDAADMHRTDEGYAEQLLAIARQHSPRLSLIKLGCPGETTTSLIDGGICSYRHGSQLDEAVSFLRAHRNHVAFITIDIGANDFPCQAPECFPAGVAKIQANLPKILSALRKAAGRDVPIVGMTIYNPFLAAWLLGGQDYAKMSQLDMMGPLNDLFRGIYKAGGAKVADVERAFSSDDFTTLVSLPGVGEVPLNVARICAWTWVCAPGPLGPDNHANADGYQVIARAFAAKLRLSPHR